MIFLCEISSGYCKSKIMEIDSVFIELFKNKKGEVFETL